jgi:hypothetical protein
MIACSLFTLALLPMVAMTVECIAAQLVARYQSQNFLVHAFAE